MTLVRARAAVFAAGFLALSAALVVSTLGASAPPGAARPAAPAAIVRSDDVLELVRGGIAEPYVSGSRVAVASDIDATIVLTAAPGVRVARTLRLALRDAAGPLDDARVEVAARMRFMDHGSFDAVGVAAGDGAYVVDLPFAMNGEWELTMTVRSRAGTGRVVLDVTEYD